MVFVFLDVSTTPKTNSFLFWRHQETPNNSRNILLESQIFGNDILTNLEKMDAEHPGDLFICLKNLEYGINVYQKT